MARKARPTPAAGEVRRRLRLSVLIGATATLAVMALDMVGGLAAIEFTLLDWRFRTFTRFNPPPSDRIVHIDIDDNSLETVGRWPWPRAELAKVVDELNRAGAAVTAFDVLFSERQRDVPRTASGDAADPPPGAPPDDDTLLAQSIARGGNVLLPIALDLSGNVDPLLQRVRKALEDDPAIATADLPAKLELTDEQRSGLAGRIGALRAGVFRQKLARLFDQTAPRVPSLQEARQAVLPQLPAYVTRSPLLDTLRDEFDRVQSLRLLASRLPREHADRIRLGRGTDPTVPISQLAAAAATTGFVTFEYDGDGVVRRIPLWLTDGSVRYPQFSLAAACQLLKVPMDRVRMDDRHTILPGATMPDGSTRDIRLPMLRPRLGEGVSRIQGHMLIPWQTGSADWRFLFDPAGRSTRQHLPIGLLVELADLRPKTAENQAQADLALLRLAAVDKLGLDARPLERLAEAGAQIARSPESKWLAQRDQARKEILDELDFRAGDFPPDSPEGQAIRQAIEAHRAAVIQADSAVAQIAQAEAKLHPQLRGSVCLIGWTGTGAIADFISTSLEPKVPGVVVHGALLNAILTGHFIERASVEADLMVVAVIGLAATLIAGWMSPLRALVLTAGLGGGYVLLNGAALFDAMNLWLDAAGPLLACVGAWGGVTVHRFAAEQRERARITRQFKNYVAPGLVDFLVENPHLIKLEGEKREMTCIFTDFAGFTRVSDQLGPEGTVQLLNKYLSVATDQLMEHHATVNKYLGDGILAFWGAPVLNADHALDACRSVLSCQKALAKLSDDPELSQMPMLTMRAGIATGPMMVGDFGAPPRRSDYTILGDTVNLASRLENANKQFGTKVLISGQTHQIVRERFLCRPIGRIVVVGRRNAEPVYELMDTQEQATPEQRKLVESSQEACEAYYAGDFPRAIQCFLDMVNDPGLTHWANRFLESCEHHLRNGTDPAKFDGALILTEK